MGDWALLLVAMPKLATAIAIAAAQGVNLFI